MSTIIKHLNIFHKAETVKKHDRKIELTLWQKIIVDKYPQEFLRALFESDGCRYINKVKKKNIETIYCYVNYNFTNVSKDIIDILALYLNKLNIKYRLQNKKIYGNDLSSFCMIASTKKDVAFLDTFIGPKK